MIVNLNIAPLDLEKAQEQAKERKQSRKAYLETILTDAIRGNNPVMERYDGPPADDLTSDEPKQWQEAKEDKPVKSKPGISDFWKQRMEKKLGIKQ